MEFVSFDTFARSNDTLHVFVRSCDDIKLFFDVALEYTSHWSVNMDASVYQDTLKFQSPEGLAFICELDRERSHDGIEVFRIAYRHLKYVNPNKFKHIELGQLAELNDVPSVYDQVSEEEIISILTMEAI